MKVDSFVELLGDAFVWGTIRRVKTIVVAIGTATTGNGSITIGASKARIEAEFLNARTK
jgi:hypothetical protein